MKKILWLVIISLLILSITSTCSKQVSAEWMGTIYIRPDGSIDPPSVPIERIGIFEITYVFTDDIYGNLVIQRSNVTIDGSGFMLYGNGTGTGLYIGPYTGPTLVGNITVKNLKIRNFEYGIYLKHSGNNKIINNIVTNNSRSGITLWGSSASNNYIKNNTLTSNMHGIDASLGWGDNNILNNIIEHNKGIGLIIGGSNNNILNNIIRNNEEGLVLLDDGNTLRNNTMVRNCFNFRAHGEINDVDTSNTVDGKPIYYWINKRDEIVPEDAGYVALVNCGNITVSNIKIRNNGEGIVLASTQGSRIVNNTLMDNRVHILCFGGSYNIISDNVLIAPRTWHLSPVGISISSSDFNNISRNIIDMHTAWGKGITLRKSNHNYIVRNIIVDNNIGVHISSEDWKDCKDNVFYHNAFINNYKQVEIDSTDAGNLTNIWHGGYPRGGNYWSNYDGQDKYSGPNQDMPGSDRIGDVPYFVGEYWQHPYGYIKIYDLYPLMDPKTFPAHYMFVVWWETDYYINIWSNSVITDFYFSQPAATLSFTIMGEVGTDGCCNISIPKALMRGEPWTVKLNGTEWIYELTENKTHSFLYFTFTLASIYEVTIEGTWVVPEFPSTIMLLGLSALVTIPLVFIQKKYNRKTES